MVVSVAADGAASGGPTRRSVASIDAELTSPGQPFEVSQIEVRGVATKVWARAPLTLGEILERSRGYGDRPFIIYEGDRLTFEQHHRAAARWAHVLRHRFGIQPGDRVAIAMRNHPEWSVAFWGAAAAGAVVVALNALWSADELAYGLADSGSRLVVADGERARRIGGGRAQLPGLEEVVVVRSGGDRPADTLDWEEVLSPAPDRVDLPATAVGPEDDATIFYTSGTTGRAKGALGTHRNICTNPLSSAYVGARAAARAGRPTPTPGPPQVYLLSVPLFHATGCHSLLVGHLYAGSTMVMMHRWDAGRALELIEQHRVTSFGGVPTMALQVLDHPDLDRRDTSSLQSVRFGGAPAPPDLVRRIQERFGATPAMNGYGMTETSALASMISGDDYAERPDSVGVPVPVVSMKVVDPDGDQVPTDQVGELMIAGPTVVKGYWGRPDATAEAFVDGWVRTGDVARVDADGFVYIVDRAKDMLIRGGENVYCAEVEGALYEHPAVAEAAVIGVPHPTLGEEVGAVVSLRAGATVGAADLQAHVAARLAAFKVPARIWFHAGDLPRNPAGKVLKRDLRASVLDPG